MKKSPYQAVGAIRPSSLLRLQRVLALEVALMDRGVRHPVRFERNDGCFGAFGTDQNCDIVEFRVDPFSGDIFEIEHDPEAWPQGAYNALPL